MTPNLLRNLADKFNSYAENQETRIQKGWVRGRVAADAETQAETWRRAADEVLLLAAKLEMVT